MGGSERRRKGEEGEEGEPTGASGTKLKPLGPRRIPKRISATKGAPPMNSKRIPPTKRTA